MPFDSTRRRAPGRFLDWKLRLFFIAAVLLLIGMARGFNLLVLIAIALLAVAIVLRFLERRTEETPAYDEEEEIAEDEEYAGEFPPSAELRDVGPATRPIREEPRPPVE
jgi:type III secretory pathway component EscV